jgi:hypothetical protein
MLERFLSAESGVGEGEGEDDGDDMMLENDVESEGDDDESDESGDDDMMLENDVEEGVDEREVIDENEAVRRCCIIMPAAITSSSFWLWRLWLLMKLAG